MKALLAAVLFMGSTVVATAETSAIEVSDAYVRAMPPGRTITAAFFEARNDGDSACTLVSAETDIADRVELHTHRFEDGLMKMREVKRVDLPAGESVSFKPGGLHIMLYDVRSLEDGETVGITLRFEECEDLTIDAEVRGLRR